MDTAGMLPNAVEASTAEGRVPRIQEIANSRHSTQRERIRQGGWGADSIYLRMVETPKTYDGTQRRIVVLRC